LRELVLLVAGGLVLESGDEADGRCAEDHEARAAEEWSKHCLVRCGLGIALVHGDGRR